MTAFLAIVLGGSELLMKGGEGMGRGGEGKSF